MVIKTFNLDEEVYKQFSQHCKKNGISMSKRVENFLKEEVSKINNKIAKKNIIDKNENNKISSGHHSFSKYC
ncbi:MAG: hypothetical protein ACP5N7_00250 [Candidatus Pacearchaeota archaeon]